MALKEFVIAIKTELDQSQMLQALKKAESHVKDVANKIHADMSDAVAGLGHNFVGLATSIGAITAVAGGAFAGLAEIAGGIDDIGDFAQKMNVSTQSLQELGYAAQLSGSSIEDAKATIEGISKVTGEAALGVGRGAAIFEKLGLSAKDSNGKVKDSAVMLGEISEKLRGLNSRAEQLAFAEKLGINSNMLPLLTDATGQYDKLIAEAREFGTTNSDAFDNAGAFNDNLDKIKFAFTTLTQNVASQFLPLITEVTDSFIAFYKENKAEIQQKLVNFFTVISQVVKGFIPILKLTFGTFVKLFDFLANNKWIISALTLALTGLIGIKAFAFFTSLAKVALVATQSMRAFGAVLLANPIIIIGAALVGLALIIEDFSTYLDGGESALGSYYAKWQWLTNILSGAIAMLNAVVTVFEATGVAIGESAGAIVLAFGSATNSVMSFVDYIFGSFTGAIATIQNAWNSVSDFLGFGDKKIEVTRNDNTRNLANTSNPSRGITPNQITPKPQVGVIDRTRPSTIIPIANNAPIANAPVITNNYNNPTTNQATASKTANSVVNDTKVTNNVTIRVDGSVNPDATAKRVQQEINRINRDTIATATAPSQLR